MSNIKRYFHNTYEEQMDEVVKETDGKGEYVLFSDHEQLVDEIQSKLDRAIDALSEASKYANMDDVNGMAGLICDEALQAFREKHKGVV